jgi:hypothetical protein
MSDFKMKQEIKNLIKMGISEEMATLVAAAKYGNLDLASEIVSGIADENEALKESLVDFKPYEPEDTSGQIITPQSSSSALDYLSDESQDTVNLYSNDMVEKTDVENEIENI